MIPFIGTWQFKNLAEKSLEKISFGGINTSIPLDDLSLFQTGTTWFSDDRTQLAWLSNREILRQITSENGFKTPAWKVDCSLEKLAVWCIKRNLFPLAIKPCTNDSESRKIFRLSGFRDLSTFYVKINGKGIDKIILEEWVKGKYIFEITHGAGGFELISQIGLRKDLTCKTVWRIFPLKLPQSLKSKILPIMKTFDKFLDRPAKLLRYTFSVDEKDATLISINGGFNRLEYYPGWNGLTDGKSPFEKVLSGAAAEPISGETKFMIHYFRKNKKENQYPEKLPEIELKAPVISYFRQENMAVALFTSNIPENFQKSIKELEFVLAE
ncbi:MAG: hypothetical protein HQM08_08955 [Candidatus Riflebacteria bacterium]|nr:hypothetical protein [Candidatus Riflebacteria bacterium]